MTIKGQGGQKSGTEQPMEVKQGYPPIILGPKTARSFVMISPRGTERHVMGMSHKPGIGESHDIDELF